MSTTTSEHYQKFKLLILKESKIRPYMQTLHNIPSNFIALNNNIETTMIISLFFTKQRQVFYISFFITYATVNHNFHFS